MKSDKRDYNAAVDLYCLTESLLNQSPAEQEKLLWKIDERVTSWRLGKLFTNSLREPIKGD